MPTAAVNGIDVHYEREGAGPPLLFINGSGATLAGTAPLLKPFRRGFDLAAYDQRGLGRTSVPPGPYSMADYAADALGLLDHLGWERVRVVGISFGGMVAQELAVTAPERVERLALLCTSPGGADRSSFPLHELEALEPEARRARGTAILDTRFTPEFLAADPRSKAIADVMAARGDGERTEDEVRGARLQLEARRHHDVWERLPRISCPTLVAAGRYDGIAPLANSEAIAEQIPEAELRCYEGGHAFFVQDRTALPEVVAFLSGR